MTTPRSRTALPAPPWAQPLRLLALATLLLAALLASSSARAQGAQFDTQSIIINPLPSFEVQVTVDRDPSGELLPEYRIGDPIRITVWVSDDSYVYLFNVRATGAITQLLPNRLDGDNFLFAGESRTFPPPGARYQLLVDGPTGIDKVIAVASREPLDTSTLAQFRSGDFAQSSIGERGFADALSIIVTPLPNDTWVTDTVRFRITGFGAQPPAPTPPPAPQRGTLDLRSSPSGASVFLDGAFLGVTPLRVSTSAGQHQLRFELGSYQPFETTVTVRSGETLTVNAALQPLQPSPRFGTLRFQSVPSGAEVFLDGRFLGVTPTGPITVEVGAHQVRFSLAGFRDAFVDVTVREGDNRTVSASLVSQPTISSGQVIFDDPHLTLPPEAFISKLERKREKLTVEFEIFASLDRIFDDLDTQLQLAGWRRADLEYKDSGRKVKADYRRGDRELELELARKGNRDEFELELKLDD